jgi:hypothetical protein
VYLDTGSESHLRLKEIKFGGENVTNLLRSIINVIAGNLMYDHLMSTRISTLIVIFL